MKPEYQPCSSTSDLCSNAESTPCLDEHGRWPKQKKSWLTSRLPLWTVVTLFVAATLVNAFIFVQRSTSSQQHVPLLWNYFLQDSSGSTYSQVQERTYWDYDDDFLDFNTTRATEFWRSLFPLGEGIIGLSDEEVADMGLPDSIRGRTDPTKHLFLVGAFHQLHCLGVLRKHTMTLFQKPEFTMGEATYHHTMHCVDILRQALLCNSDSTLIKKVEGQWPGDGQVFQCRNFDALTQWTTEHAYISAPDLPEDVFPAVGHT